MSNSSRQAGFVEKLRALKSLLPHAGMLRERGLAKSLQKMSPIDVDGNPLPWMSYPFIDYMAGLDLSKFRLFEFGSGNSTRYWAQRCSEVVAVENDRRWFEEISGIVPPNARVIFAEDEAAYLGTIEQNGVFDVIVVDGAMDRRRMAERAVRFLQPTGFLVLDNSDVWVSAAQSLRNAGLIQVDMTGFAPAAHFEQTTSLFLQPGFRPVPLRRFMPVKTPWCMQHIIDE